MSQFVNLSQTQTRKLMDSTFFDLKKLKKEGLEYRQSRIDPKSICKNVGSFMTNNSFFNKSKERVSVKVEDILSIGAILTHMKDWATKKLKFVNQILDKAQTADK